ncbi:MAG: ribonuclease HI family protein [Phycisphaerae bacterium]|nr:ribonuclease HI family protein [Phycisphaerae bacterium]MDW8262736.1 ribonuclease HI family protein [Phycisphaerales bacterium]
MDQTVTIQFDGGADPNPGPAAFGVVILAEDGTPLITYGKYIGTATNNVAEYNGLITGLRRALTELHARRAIVCGDSELVIRQMKGEYKVRNAGLKPLYEEARKLADRFESIEYRWNVRDQNFNADKLVRLARNRRGEVHDVED